MMRTLVAVVKFATMESTPVMPERANTLLDGMTMSDGSKYSRSVTVFWYERLVSMYCDRCSLAVLKSKAASPTCMHEIMQVVSSWRSAREKSLQKIPNAKNNVHISMETRSFFGNTSLFFYTPCKRKPDHDYCGSAETKKKSEIMTYLLGSILNQADSKERPTGGSSKFCLSRIHLHLTSQSRLELQVCRFFLFLFFSQPIIDIQTSYESYYKSIQKKTPYYSPDHQTHQNFLQTGYNRDV